MFKIATPFLIPSRQSSELKAVNEKIAKLAAAKPYRDLYGDTNRRMLGQRRRGGPGTQPLFTKT